MNNIDFEAMVSSLIFYNKINVIEFKFTKEMFKNKINYEFITHSQNGALNGISQEDLNQQFISKKELFIYEELFLDSELKKFKKETILEIFYKQAIDFIWSKKQLDNTNINLLEELSQVVEEIKQIIIDLDSKKEKKNPFDKYRENLMLTKQRLDSGDYEQGVIGMKSGLPQLDLITGGFKEGEYILIAGRPSMGKTSLALDIAINGVKEGKNIQILSLEMTAEQLIARAIPKINNNITLANSVYGENLDSKLEEIMVASEFLEKSGLEIEDFSNESRVTIIEIQKAIESYKKKHGYYPDMIIIDYIQIIKAINTKSDNENINTTEISSVLQRLGKKTKSSLIVLSQLNRALEERKDKRPLQSDLRSSGSLEQDADIIIFVYRDAIYLERSLTEKLKSNPGSNELAEALQNLKQSKTDIAEIIVSKNRNGALGTATAEFYKPAASYVSSASVFTMNEDLEAEFEDF